MVRRSTNRRPARLLPVLMAALVTAGACGIDEVEADFGGVGADEKKVVYGTDNRMDVYAHPDATLRARAAQATVALMEPSAINTANPNAVTFNAESLQSAYGLCSSERFLNDPTAAFCSGTLIDDDLVLTAGHCVTNTTDCQSTRFVFNYYRTAANALHQVTTADIYSCASIVVRRQATVSGQELDYAILRLDRAATPRFTPAPVRAGNAPLGNGQNVAVIGSGSGVPFKIDSGGSVRDNRPSTLDYFVATTDTFGGNSGSGVYETNGYTVAGILVRGDTDYRRSGSCSVVNVCAESGCMGEEITYVQTAVSALCAAANSARLCGNPPPPPPPPPPPSNGTSFTFVAANTNNATTGTTNKSLQLAAGDALEVGTCSVTGALASGDTYLRLYGGSTEVAANDDACGGRASYFKYVATSSGPVEIRAGCYANLSCSGTVAWKITPATTPPPPTTNGSYTFSTTATTSAQRNTANRTVTLAAGQTIRLGTCTVAGASGSGDTYVRLATASGALVAANDDSCGLLSYLSYTVPAGSSGSFEIRAGCYAEGSCSGTLAYTIE